MTTIDAHNNADDVMMMAPSWSKRGLAPEDPLNVPVSKKPQRHGLTMIGDSKITLVPGPLRPGGCFIASNCTAIAPSRMPRKCSRKSAFRAAPRDGKKRLSVSTQPATIPKPSSFIYRFTWI